MKSASLKNLRLGWTIFALASALSTGCGFAPTRIGRELDAFSDGDDIQLESLHQIIEGRSIEFVSATRKLCIDFFFGTYEKRPRPSYQIGCALYEVAEDGKSTKLKEDSECRLSFIEQTPADHTVLLECAHPGQTPCLGEGTEIGRLKTSADFYGIVEAGGNVDGLKISDDANPAVSSTVHDSTSYCEFEQDDAGV